MLQCEQALTAFANAGADHSVVKEGQKPGSEQESAQAQQSENIKRNGESLRAQQHVVRAEAGPDVHVDKAAGVVNITGLPLGCRYVITVQLALKAPHELQYQQDHLACLQHCLFMARKHHSANTRGDDISQA